MPEAALPATLPSQARLQGLQQHRYLHHVCIEDADTSQGADAERGVGILLLSVSAGYHAEER